MTGRKFTIAAAGLALFALSAAAPSRFDFGDAPLSPSAAKPIIGQIAFVSEVESGLDFLARVDTGAAFCSVHAIDVSIDGGSDDLHANVGKIIRFRIANRTGQSAWLERSISDVKKIRNSNGAELRYTVSMTFTCLGIQREVLVSLNDRSEMNYAMLLGRNLLSGEFVVDVAHGS